MADYTGMAEVSNVEALVDAIAKLRELLSPSLGEGIRGFLSRAKIRQLRADVGTVCQRLMNLDEELDPIRAPAEVVDLTNPRTTGRFIGRMLEEVKAEYLDAVEPFYGSGVYAIYYSGDFAAYLPIRNTTCPIYVGKADPKSPDSMTPRQQGPKLWERLREHRRTIGRAGNLAVMEFMCRYLVIQTGLQKAAEEYLIGRYSPIWNNEVGVCSGIGKHGDTARRERSAWDVLHPGRRWADAQESRSGLGSETVAANIEAHFRALCKAEPELWIGCLNPEWCAGQGLSLR